MLKLPSSESKRTDVQARINRLNTDTRCLLFCRCNNEAVEVETGGCGGRVGAARSSLVSKGKLYLFRETCPDFPFPYMNCITLCDS